MVKVRDGDVDKLGLLFERYKRSLYGFFYGMNRNQEVSEDLVQNTFFRILKYKHLFRGEGDFRTWMFHIARNVSHDHYRKDKIKGKDPIEDWQERLPNHESTSAQMDHVEEHQMLAIAMERLPADKREILLLSKYQEKKYKEIGDIIGCTEGAVKVKVFRALQELKVIYQHLEKTM
jgi:RNA polymerase sigma factor (sigma-70 family)